MFENLKKKFDGRPWYEWPKKYRDRDPTALAEIATDATSQARFMGRWKKIREYFIKSHFHQLENVLTCF